MLDYYRKTIAGEFEDCIVRTIERLKNVETNHPFHEAMLSKEALFWSRFERSFSTSFGQRVIQRISKVAALAGGASAAEILRETSFSLPSSQLEAIDVHISSRRQGHSTQAPHWQRDIDNIRKTTSSSAVRTVKIIWDVWWIKKNIQHFMSIKTVKPNIDQTEQAKRDLLKLSLHFPEAKVYFGLYYNPYGNERNDYAWAPPKGVFDFQNDEVVLIGRDYWDTLGGPGFYEEVLTIADEVGQRTRKMLQDLKIGKTPDDLQMRLKQPPSLL